MTSGHSCVHKNDLSHTAVINLLWGRESWWRWEERSFIRREDLGSRVNVEPSQFRTLARDKSPGLGTDVNACVCVGISENRRLPENTRFTISLRRIVLDVRRLDMCDDGLYGKRD